VVRRGADVFWIVDQQVPFAVLGDQWIAFDDDNSLINKVCPSSCGSLLHHPYILLWYDAKPLLCFIGFLPRDATLERGIATAIRLSVCHFSR